MKKLFLFLFLFLFLKNSYALIPLEKIKSNDRILIVAPHPDDEILATGGVIQEALKDKAKVKVLYITDGEHNIPSLIFYKKFFFKKKISIIDLGEIRKAESIMACKTLGLSKDNLIFLDYPDSGILKIFLEHWGKQEPFMDSLTKSTFIEKNEGISPHALYKGENILSDIKKVLLDFKPNKIFLPSPFDRNPDHIGSYLFTKLALLDLRNELNTPRLYLYVVHRKSFSIFERYKPEFYLKFPSDLNVGKDWMTLKLTEGEKNKKKEAILKFKSQMYCKKFLLSFVNDEIFEKELANIVLDRGRSFNSYLKKRNKKIAKINISFRNGNIVYKIYFLKNINPDIAKGRIYLFGYKEKEGFEYLPKIYLNFRGKKWNLYNQGKRIKKSKEIAFKINREYLEFKIPISILENSDLKFTSTKATPLMVFTAIEILSDFHNLYLPWRIIELR